MSNSLISRSADLTALETAGYSLEVRGAYLLVRGIPYILSDGGIKSADIVTNLDVTGAVGEEVTTPPGDHTVWWTGGIPHTAGGENMKEYLSCGKWEQGRDIGEGITVYMQWSRKPKEGGRTRGYRDYHEKIATYIDEVGGQAESMRPGILEAARRGGKSTEISSTRFAYMDTNSYRNGTKGIEARIEEEIVAVIGVGGTGSYLVDVLAKTNVKALHLFDADVMKVHNAFRVAGAARVGELNGRKYKIDWHAERYKAVRITGLYLHHLNLEEESFDKLRSCTTAFIAVDDLTVRRKLQRVCNEMGISHVSVGIGLEVEGENDDQIGGMVKIETNFDPGEPRKEISEHPGGARENPDDVYSSNIQTAELNMLGAALAIAEWKAIKGVYRSERDKMNDTTIYSVTTGEINIARKGAVRSDGCAPD